MFNPFLEDQLIELSDDQLLDKINEVANKVSSARRSGMSYTMLSQLEMVYHQLNTAYQERLIKKNSKNMDTTSLEIGHIEGDVTDAE